MGLSTTHWRHRAQCRFPRCHRQLDDQVGAVDAKARMPAEAHFEQQVAGRPAVHAWVPFPARRMT